MGISKRIASVAFVLLAVAVLLILSISVLPMTAHAETEGYFTYTVSDGKATVTACNGAMGGNVIIPSTLGGYPVTAIGERVLYDCSWVKTVVIPEGVETIGAHSFRRCSALTSVTVPKTVTRIWGGVFSQCKSLTGIWVHEDNANYCSDEKGVLYTKDKTKLMQAPGALAGEYVIPECVTYLHTSSFEDCIALTAITIPETVVDLSGGMTFMGCTNLTTVNMHGNMGRIEQMMFRGCKSLANVVVPEGIQYVGSYAFSYCDNLETVTFPESVTELGWYLFTGCSKLRAVVIPKAVNMIPEATFENCSALTDVYYSGTKQQWEAVVIGECNEYLATANIHYGTSVIPVAFTYEILNQTAKVTGLSAPASGAIAVPSTLGGYPVTTIGTDAFAGCTELTAVKLPGTVTTIEDNAFYGCTGLTSVNIPKGVTRIPFGCFQDCTSLWSVKLPEGVTSIGGSAFENCDALTSVVVPEGVTGFGVGAFSLCDNLASVYLPKSLPKIREGAFYKCPALTDLYYTGTEDEWEKVYSEDIDFPSADMVIHCNAVPQTPCDFTGDNKLTDTDAIYLLRYTLFPESYSIRGLLDLTVDGTVTDADAIYLLRHTLFPEYYPI